MHIKIVTLITLALYTSPLMSSCCRRDHKTTYELIPATNSPTHSTHINDDFSDSAINQVSAQPRYILQKPPATKMETLLTIGKYGAYGAGLVFAAGIVVTVSMAIPYLPYLPSIAENLEYLKNVTETLLACPAAQECLIKAAEHCH